jgi:hypothetical protein
VEVSASAFRIEYLDLGKECFLCANINNQLKLFNDSCTSYVVHSIAKLNTVILRVIMRSVIMPIVVAPTSQPYLTGVLRVVSRFCADLRLHEREVQVGVTLIAAGTFGRVKDWDVHLESDIKHFKSCSHKRGILKCLAPWVGSWPGHNVIKLFTVVIY